MQRPHTCPYCSQSYLRASHLTAHLRTHLSEEDRPFACGRPGCGKRFWTSTHLKRHQEVHDEVPTHKVSLGGLGAEQTSRSRQCEHCEMAFTKAHNLRDHIVLAHMPAGTKPYICDYSGCSASFALRNQLKAHEKTHDGERPCPYGYEGSPTTRADDRNAVHLLTRLPPFPTLIRNMVSAPGAHARGARPDVPVPRMSRPAVQVRPAAEGPPQSPRGEGGGSGGRPRDAGGG